MMRAAVNVKPKRKERLMTRVLMVAATTRPVAVPAASDRETDGEKMEKN